MTATRKEVTDVSTTGVHNLDDTVKDVVLGVQTHLNFHVAVVMDGLWAGISGRVEDSNDPHGLYGQLLRWAQGFGVLRCAAVEGTGTYGALGSLPS